MRSARTCALVVLGVVTAMLTIAPAAAAAGTRTCAEAVLEDWHDGPIGEGYAPGCYRAALASLPEDLRIYSTASDDIKSALHARLAALAAQRARARTERRVLSAHTGARHSTRSREGRPVVRAALTEGVASRDSRFPVPVLVAAAAAAALVGLAGTSQAARRLRRRRSG
jgi:hypothetical protein